MAVLKTYGEQLAEVQAAITAVLTSQRYEINGRSAQRADLEWLHKREEYLSDRLASVGDVIAGATMTSGRALVSFE
jgi:glutathione S-transferase